MSAFGILSFMFLPSWWVTLASASNGSYFNIHGELIFTAFTKLASFLGCEDIIIGELLSPSTLVPTLKWSCQPHGSAWVYSQAIQFLQEEFVNIAQSESFYLLPRSYLVEALKSDFLQVCLSTCSKFRTQRTGSTSNLKEI